MHRLLLPGMTALLLTGLAVTPVAAQEASPRAGEMVDPAACQIEPLSDDGLVQFAGTPESEGTPVPDVAGSPGAFTEPEGEAAGDAEVEAATAVMREVVACLNAADYRRVYALYSEKYRARSLSPEQVDVAAATPQPSDAATQVALVGVDEVILLPDGRLGAKVHSVTGPEAVPITSYVVFVQEGDRWLIDEQTVLESHDDAATPAA